MKSEFITMYLPIFREKLARLEGRGEGAGAEALRLRRTIARAERTAPADPANDRPAGARQDAAA